MKHPPNPIPQRLCGALKPLAATLAFMPLLLSQPAYSVPVAPGDPVPATQWAENFESSSAGDRAEQAGDTWWHINDGAATNKQHDCAVDEGNGNPGKAFRISNTSGGGGRIGEAGYITWTSDSVTIVDSTSARVSVDVMQDDNGNDFEESDDEWLDYVELYYQVNGGAPVRFGRIDGDTESAGNFDGAGSPVTYPRGSDIFRSVWGDEEMPLTSPDPRCRPLYSYQYDNSNNTALSAFSFIDNYFNNAAGNHVSTPHPVNYFWWGGTAASYWSTKDRYGVIDDFFGPGDNHSVESPEVQAGTAELRPEASGWSFTGTAGVYANNPRTGGSVVAAGASSTSVDEYDLRGFKFTVGPKDVAVYEVGRYVLAGNRSSHEIAVYDAQTNEKIFSKEIDLDSAEAGLPKKMNRSTSTNGGYCRRQPPRHKRPARSTSMSGSATNPAAAGSTPPTARPSARPGSGAISRSPPAPCAAPAASLQPVPAAAAPGPGSTRSRFCR